MKQKRKARSLLAALLAALLLAAAPLSAYATAAPATDVTLTIDLTSYANFEAAVQALSNAPALDTVTTLTITGGFQKSKEWSALDGSYLIEHFPALDTLDMKDFTGTYLTEALAPVQGQSTKIRRVRLPAGVTITSFMFYKYYNLTTLVCGSGAWQDGVIDLTGAVSYKASAFFDCRAITQVRLPDSIEIPDAMFIGCTGLKTLVCGSGAFASGVIDLTGYTGGAYGRSLFQSCSAIEQVRLPDSIDIPSAMFSQCTGLKALTFVGSSTNAPSVGTYAFHNVPTGGTLSYPAGAAGYDPLCDTQNTPVLNDWTRVPVAPPPPTPTPAPAAEGTPHVCDFGDWQYSNEHHWKRCSCMALSDYAPHVFNSARVCTVCGYGAKPKKFNPPTGVYESSLPRFA